jgi:ankyrin repeat protein
VKAEGHGRGAAAGPAGSTWTDGACSTIPLCAAAHDGELEMVRELIADGADVDEQDAYGWTALMRATGQGHAAIAVALLKAGARVDLQDKDGMTALMAATHHGHTAIAEALVKAGAQTVAMEPKEKKIRKKKRRVIQYVPPADL